MIDRIDNARGKRCHCPTSPNTAPVTKNERPKCEGNLMKKDETSFTSRAGQAGGGGFQEKNYKSKKKFAYRMCTG